MFFYIHPFYVIITIVKMKVIKVVKIAYTTFFSLFFENISKKYGVFLFFHALILFQLT